MMESHSASVTAIGFSHTICLPPSAAMIACSAWTSFGVDTQTTSTSLDLHSVSTLSKVLIPGYFSAIEAQASGRRSATAASTTLSAILPICGRTCVAAMPTPAMPRRSFSAIDSRLQPVHAVLVERDDPVLPGVAHERHGRAAALD